MSDDEILARVDAKWRAANYLSAGQTSLMDNPLLERPLEPPTSSRAFAATGALRPASTSCRCTSTARSERATSTCSPSPGPAMAARRCSPMMWPRVPS